MGDLPRLSFRDPLELGRRPALFLDFDGTLVPISSRPSDVHLSEEHARLLGLLAGTFPTFVISGRGESDLLARLPGVALAGISADHGAVRILAGERYLHPEAERAREGLPDLSVRIREEMEAIPGVLVEVKEFSLSIHYRLMAPERIGEARERLERVLAESVGREGGPGLRISEGKKVWEIRPARGVTKEESLDFFLDWLSAGAMGSDAYFPVMAGDDTTDLAAVNRARARGGIGVWVGSPPLGLDPGATVLASPEELWVALRALLRDPLPPSPGRGGSL